MTIPGSGIHKETGKTNLDLSLLNLECFMRCLNIVKEDTPALH